MTEFVRYIQRTGAVGNPVLDYSKRSPTCCNQ